MERRTFQRAAAAMALATLTGCASLPAPEVMRAEAANFQLPRLPDAGKAMVYVVRPSAMGGFVRFNVFVNDQEAASEMGYTRASEYIWFQLPPGTHKLYSKAENWAETTVTAKAGDVIFIEQEPAFGVIMSRNNLNPLPDYRGRYHVKTLKPGTVLKTDR